MRRRPADTPRCPSWAEAASRAASVSQCEPMGGTSGAASRVVPTVTIKSTEAWPVPVGGSAARPGGRAAQVPPHAELRRTLIGASFLGLSRLTGFNLGFCGYVPFRRRWRS